MAFDIKKIAIALGCAGVVAFVIGRINSGSNDNGYQPITSFSEQGESLVQQGQMQIQELSQSVVTENIRQLPGQLLDETPISIDTPTALLETPNQFEAKPLVEDENQFMISQPEMVEVDMVEEDSDLVLDFAEEPMQDDVSTPAQPEAPQADAVTEQMVEQPKPAVENKGTSQINWI